ncbi:hypothetical protein HPB52_025616 [Rhipicephalus sanguineus]|uniref:Fatty acyl-CoA reductase C-terminal domain-containing protein n=1 Tax=Rhipicephalus sanguineus TaxID=34632 RepID=A0A9D4YRF7_RHISA|nr:hypothetical protein HPB52_025616 [Rhipicephalus sanguineus]
MTQKPEDAKEDPPEAGRVRRQAATAATAAAAADDVPGPSTETPAAKRPRGRPPKAVSVEPIAPKPTAARKSRKVEDAAQPATETPSTSKAVPTKARRVSRKKRSRSSSPSSTVDTASDAPRRRGARRRTFDFDIRSIDWVAYMEQYILGVRRYVLKEDPSTIPTARRNLNRIYYIGMLAQLLFVAGVIRLLVKHTRTFNDLWWSLVSNILQLAVRISLAVQSIASRH